MSSREKVTNVDEFIKYKILTLEEAPLMWAVTREAFAVQIWMLLELYIKNNIETAVIFMRDLFEVPGTNHVVTGLVIEVTEDWCREVVNKAKKLMPELYNVSD